MGRKSNSHLYSKMKKPKFFKMFWKRLPISAGIVILLLVGAAVGYTEYLEDIELPLASDGKWNEFISSTRLLVRFDYFSSEGFDNPFLPKEPEEGIKYSLLNVLPARCMDNLSFDEYVATGKQYCYAPLSMT